MKLKKTKKRFVIPSHKFMCAPWVTLLVCPTCFECMSLFRHKALAILANTLNSHFQCKILA